MEVNRQYVNTAVFAPMLANNLGRVVTFAPSITSSQVPYLIIFDIPMNE